MSVATTPIIQMDIPNEKILIYKGDFILKNLRSESIIINGEVYFKWFPNIGAKFFGKISNGIITNPFIFEGALELIINENVVGKCLVTNQTIDEIHKLSGEFLNDVIIGDKSLKAQKFKFSLLNFQDFLGENIVSDNNGITTLSRGRILLKHESFEVYIDKDIFYKEKFKLLKEEGGYQILYNGEINFFKDSMGFEEIKGLIKAIGVFLSFVSGKKNSPLFTTAIYQDEILYKDFSCDIIKSYEYRHIWCNLNSTHYLNNLFLNFYQIWKSNSDNEFFLSSIVHWYINVNCNTSYNEGSLVIAQTALELLYNWLIVENKKLIIGKDSESISAASKIRLLISHLSITYDVPSKFENLEIYRKDNKLNDGVEAIVQIRNAIVHSQEAKRLKLKKINDMAIYESVQLSLWYIELVVLYILKFEDKYVNRCSNENVVAKKLEMVPWFK